MDNSGEETPSNPPPMMQNPRIMEALVQVSLAINAELDVSEGLKKVVYWARKLVNCSEASILIWDARREVFLQSASTNENDADIKVHRKWGSTRWIVDNGKPLIVPDVVHDPHSANAMLTEKRMRSYAGVPIIHGNRTIAVLYALSIEQRNFDQGEIEVLSLLASMAAVSIANAQLVESHQMLHEQRKSLMRLVAHDLLNPITNIQGFFDLLMLDLPPTSPDHQEWIRIVHRSLDRMQELIREIIRYERMVDSDALTQHRLDLAAIGRDAMKDIQLSAKAKQLTLSAPPPEQTVEVIGDSILLREVVYNLVCNAVKYTPPGGTISLSVAAAVDETTLSVRDSGVGIDPKDHAAIFEIFHRVENESEAEGSGLGLHLVRTILKRHDGDITVESSLGQGSTFHIHLPTPPSQGDPATTHVHVLGSTPVFAN